MRRISTRQLDNSTTRQLVTCALLLIATVAFGQEPTAVAVSKALVPVVGSVPGGFNTIWRTEVTLENRIGQDAFVTLTLVSDPQEAFFSTMLGAGETLTFSDVSQEAFGKAGILSPLLIQTIGTKSVQVTAAAYGVRGDSMTAPQPIPVVYGERPRAEMVLGPITHDDEYRTNLGLVNLNDAAVTFVVSVQKVQRRNLAVQTVTVPPKSMVHSPVDVLFPLLEKGRSLTILVDPAASNTYAYASMVRNSDGEARFFAPR